MSFATVNGVMLHYDWCPGDGVPLVLLHEMGGTLDSWQLVRAELSGRATLAVDLRGFGLSEKPPGPILMDDLVADIGALMNHLGIDRAHLAGGAVGGGVAIAAAAALGTRAERLTVFAPATGISPERRDGARGLAVMLQRNGVRDFFEADTIPKAWPADVFDRTGPGFEIFLSTQISTPPESLAATYRMLADLDLGSALASLQCPSTFVAGTHDVARTPSLVREVAATVKGARFVELASGHFMALQNPKEVAALLR